jgi:hypothetical protein
MPNETNRAGLAREIGKRYIKITEIDCSVAYQVYQTPGWLFSSLYRVLSALKWPQQEYNPSNDSNWK